MSPALAAAINRARAVSFIPTQPDDEPAIPVARPYLVRRKYPTLDDITAVICAWYNVTKTDLESGRRSLEVVRPRQVWMYTARKLTPTSFPSMGRYLGGRDHTTCLHGSRKIESLLPINERVRTDVAAVMESVMAVFHSRNSPGCFDPREI